MPRRHQGSAKFQQSPKFSRQLGNSAKLIHEGAFGRRSRRSANTFQKLLRRLEDVEEEEEDETEEGGEQKVVQGLRLGHSIGAEHRLLQTRSRRREESVIAPRRTERAGEEEGV